MWKKWGVIGAIAVLSWGLGCVQGTIDEQEPEGISEVGIQLTVDFQAGTDVAGFHYAIHTCDGPQVASVVKDLEDLVIPGGIPEFENTPYDEDSRHLFADYFVVLDPGCYDVYVQPVQKDGTASEDCGSNAVYEVEVVEGQTTEVLLISQCISQDTGAVDVVSSMNHPPVIEHVEYSPSKFNYECEIVEVCVTAYDPNNDPLEFVFEQTGGQQLWMGPELSRVERVGDRTVGCMEMAAVWNDDYEFRVTVYDLAWSNGEQIRIDDLVSQGSRARLTFPVYTNWDIELHCYDQEQGTYHAFNGVRDIQRLPGCIPIWPFQYYCSDFWWDETDYTCPDGEFLPETVYPLCEDYDESMYNSEPVPQPWGNYND